MRIVFFGTPQFAANTLAYLLSRGVNIVAVVTRPDSAKGRSGTPSPSEVKSLAQTVSTIPILQPERASTTEFEAALKSFNADLFVVVAYGEILSQAILDIPAKGCINVHASLLPKYRGAAPIQRCLINGESESGVSIMYLVKKMDAGDVIMIDTVPINEETTAGELEALLCKAGCGALHGVIRDLAKGIVNRTPQNETLATFAPKIEGEECELHWSRPARQLHNLVRGATPRPGAWCRVMLRGQEKRLKILKTRLVLEKGGLSAGALLEVSHSLVVACSEGALELLEVQLEGKRPLSALEFCRGLPPFALSFQL